MATNKTAVTENSVESFLDRVDDKRRADCQDLVEMMGAITRCEPRMWGASIVGFGQYHYVYDSGREGDSFLCGFSPRKQAMTLYVMAGFDRFDELMGKLGKYKTGKSCLYVKSLDDVDRKVLKRLITESVRYMKKTYA